MLPTSSPFAFSGSGDKSVRLGLSPSAEGPARLAAQRLTHVVRDELEGALEVVTLPAPTCRITAACPPWGKGVQELVADASVALLPDDRVKALAESPNGGQGFLAARTGDGRLLVLANTEIGLKNALLTLGDRLYRDANGDIVMDPIDGVHRPAFECRHLKTDAMNCGPFRSRFEYWAPASRAGVDEFADWVASFRLTDYNLLAFARGWGATYASEKYPALVDPQHPNPELNYYPSLIDRLHDWGLRVWASDIYLASGYSMETGVCPEMRSPCMDASEALPFVAGKGSFQEILKAPAAVVCLSHPAAARFYADVVDEIMQMHPSLDGLDFHIGHTFPSRICRCPKCRGLRGNREAVYRCFARACEAAIRQKPDVRLKTAFKAFGDATRAIVDRYEEFPNLEFLCWLRFAGNLILERSDAPVTTGHEDGGGGLEMNHDPKKTLAMIRNYWRDYEPWIHTYVQITRAAKLPSISWEPALHKELEQQMFLYSELSWEPDLDWAEFARRFVIRSERRLDLGLIEAYRLALEINAAATHWGLAPDEYGEAQRVRQELSVLDTKPIREKLFSLRQALDAIGLRDAPPATGFFDLRRSLAMALNRMEAREMMGHWH